MATESTPPVMSEEETNTTGTNEASAPDATSPVGPASAAASPNNDNSSSTSDTSLDDEFDIMEEEEEEKEVKAEDDAEKKEKAVEDATDVIMRAVTHKEEGNVAFKSGDLSKAERSYRRGATLLKRLRESSASVDQTTTTTSAAAETEDVSGDEQIKALLVTIQNNLSTVCFKQNKPKMSRDLASRVIAIDDRNVKALYRRAAAHRKLGNVEAAKSDLRDALRIDPNNRDVKREFAAVKRIVETNKTKTKLGLQKAFGSSATNGGGSSFLYEDKEKEAQLKAEEKRKKKEEEKEALRKRKAQWEDECVKRMSNDEPAISFEDWEKERKKEEDARKKAKKEEERKQKEERRKAKERARQEAKASGGEEDDDDIVLSERELATMRGYKKTQDGRTTSYFTRELSEDQRAVMTDMTPQRLDSNTSSSTPTPQPSFGDDAAAGAGMRSTSSPNAASAAASSSASAWNQAGTWEEKNTTEWCTKQLRHWLRSAATTTASFETSVTDVKDLTGDASVVFTGGKKRYVFDYHASVQFQINRILADKTVPMDEDDDDDNDDDTNSKNVKVASGTLKLPDISSASINDDLEVEISSWKKKKRVSSDDEKEIVHCRESLIEEVRQAVRTFVADFNSQY